MLVRSWCMISMTLVASLLLANVAAGEDRGVISGSATYRERIALSRDAVFDATLEDVSRSDAPAEVIGRARAEDPGQVPIAFEIRYDPRRIDPRHDYVVRAWIHEGDRLVFAGTQTYPVPKSGYRGKVSVFMRAVEANGGDSEGGRRGRESVLGELPATFTGLLPCADCVGIRYQVNLLPERAYMQQTTYLREGGDYSYYEIGQWSLSGDGRTLTLDGRRRSRTYWSVQGPHELRKLDSRGDAIESDLPYELTRASSVEPMQPRVRLVGMFRYMADAARFRDCLSGLQWPVDMSGEYQTLEQAYVGHRGKPGAEVMVSLEGRIEELPRTEGGGTEPTLVVEQFVAVMPGEKCEQRGVTEIGIANNRWRPMRIGDHDVTDSGKQREPWLTLESHSKRVTGFTGCNQFSGSYELDGSRLRFGPMAATRMACIDMETESLLLRALEDTRSYRVRARILELQDVDGRFLARFEERNLK